MLLEYTPNAIAKAVNPVQFLRRLLETHFCFDVGAATPQLVEVTSETVEQHRRAVSATTGGWVDLLLLAKTVPGAECACARIRARVTGTVGGRSTTALSGSSGRRTRAVHIEPQPRPPAPNAEELRLLVAGGKTAEAAARLEPVDFDTDFGTDFEYQAGVCLGLTGQVQRGIDLLKRAAAGGFGPFRCAYQLGVLETTRNRPVAAAYYYTISLILRPDKSEIYRLLEGVAPNIDPAPLSAAQRETPSEIDAQHAFDLGIDTLQSGHLGRAVSYFTIALVLDPNNGDARARLIELAPDISFSVLPLR